MDALILAAGFGSRMRGFSASKPLTPVLGVPMIEWGVRAAVAAGAERVIVATGYRAEAVESTLSQISRKIGVPIVSQRVPDHNLPNGHSVIAGASVIAGDYLLMMADHIFSPQTLQRLVAQGRQDRGVTLAVDRRIDADDLDGDDATWVRSDGQGRIVHISKSFIDYDFVDCGAFLATPELATAIATAIDAGKPGSLSDGIQILADAGRAATMDI